ncbi:hypothetical protein [Streptomyces sp. NPDC058268]|uniref:hypothetical protein n=1 Tax=Streptomyces sp. NPDC058268 TaxID=3346413 RepID=UPI0036E9C879
MGEHRVRCRRCDGQVHTNCRDITGTCYGCRWRQARVNRISGGMQAADQAGRGPFTENPPTTVTQGLPLPTVAHEQNPTGRSRNEVRVLTEAAFAGWRIDKREGHGVVLLRKHGRGYLRLTFSVFGRILHAATQRQYLDPNTSGVLAYLEGK